MANATRDQNRVTSLLGVSSADNTVPLNAQINPSTGRLLVDATGTVTGQQYTEGDTDTTITGNAVMLEAASDTLVPAQADASNNLKVNIAASDVAIGGGTEYTEGDTDTTITGKAIMWEDAADTLVTVNASKPLPVDLGANNDVTVTGLVTANAGTNLNTSALALETGGNLAGAAASLAIIDDWDETNRAAVNTISGQVGVTGGSGVVDAATQRVVLATDVALPAGTNAIGKLAANSGVDIGDVDVLSLPALAAGTNTIGAIESDGTALGNNQVSVDTTAGGTTIVSASAGRQGVIITNQGTVDCYVGTGSVTTSNGFLLAAGESLALPTDSDVKAITASSSTTVGYLSFA